MLQYILHQSWKKTDDGGYALSFHNNLYKFVNSFVFRVLPGYGYLCITFKVNGAEEQTLITNNKQSHRFKTFQEISVSPTEIKIYGYVKDELSYHTIQNNCQNWTTLFIDYTNDESGNNMKFTYILNNDPSKQGNFTFQCPKFMKSGGTIGGRKDGTRPFSGEIHGLEVYFNETPKSIPHSLKTLIIENQKVKEYI